MRLLAALALPLVPLCAVAQETAMPTPQPATLQVPWHWYRFYPWDYSQWHHAAQSVLGWTSETRPLDLSKTCLALMHLPERGLTPPTEFRPDLPDPNVLGTVEDVPRTMDLVAFRLPRLVAAARQAGLQVATIGVGESVMKSEHGRKYLREAGQAPPDDEAFIPRDQERWARHDRDLYNLPLPLNQKPGSVTPPTSTLAGMPEVLRPQGNDLVAQHSWQLARLLRNRGIDHIIYCGYALDECLWFEPCGMSDMKRRGFMCSAVRGGCVAIETRESCAGERNLEYALWKTSSVFGYVFELHELTGALRTAARPQGR